MGYNKIELPGGGAVIHSGTPEEAEKTQCFLIARYNFSREYMAKKG